MRKVLTGEPYAGEPPVRFGGKGGHKPSLPLSLNNITHYSEPVILNFEKVDIIKLIKNLISEIKSDKTLLKKIKINFHFSNKEIFLFLDPEKIKKAIFNFIITSDQNMEDGEITISAFQNNENLILSYEDETDQIQNEHLDNIFSIFTSQNQMINTLNISDSYKIIKAHLGEISVRKKEKKGSIFSIKLPIRENF
jgi:K+-sensing histidine kinase KdpD